MHMTSSSTIGYYISQSVASQQREFGTEKFFPVQIFLNVVLTNEMFFNKINHQKTASLDNIYLIHQNFPLSEIKINIIFMLAIYYW